MLGGRAKLEIELFGGMRWKYLDQQLPTSNKKLCALVAYLCLNGIEKQSRERLVGLLWGEADESRARASLRQTIRQLKSILDKAGFWGLRIERDSIQILPESFSVDVTRAYDDLSNVIVDEVLLGVDNVCETILEGYEDLDSDFRIWTLAMRENTQQKIIRMAENLFEDKAIDTAARTRFAEAIVRLDPTHEPSCRHLILYRAESGDAAGAIKIYNSLWTHLSDEYDMEPSDETIELIAAVKSGSITTVSNDKSLLDDPVGALTTHTRRYFLDTAELPVLNIETFEVAGIPDFWFHLVRGFRHSLIDSLARFREWKVADNVLPTTHEKQVEGVVYTMQCTAYVADGNLNLILTMKDLHSNLIVWSDRFNHDLHSWTDIHHRVLSKVAMALNVQLSVQKLTDILTATEVSGKIYDQWLLGQSLIMNFDPESWSKAEAIFNEIVQRSPDFSPAYSSLVQLGNSKHIAQPGVFRTEHGQQETLSIAQESVLVDPIDSRAHLALAWAYAFAGNFAQGLPHFRMAIELNEYDPWTVISAAQGFAFLGEPNLANRFSKFSLDMAFHPNPPYWGYHAGINFMCGDYNAAFEAAVKSRNALVNNGLWRAASYFQLGEIDRAKEEISDCFKIIYENWVGSTESNAENVTNWITQLFPIQSSEDQARLFRVLDLIDEPSVVTC